MNFKRFALALAVSSLSFTASAANLGTLGMTPTVQSVSISAADVTFSSPYSFTLATDSVVSAAASTLSLMLGGTVVLGFSEFSLKLFDATHTLLVTVTNVSNLVQINDVALSAGNYAFQVDGITSGLSGGAYAFAAAAKPAAVIGGDATSPVPEPATALLLSSGLLVLSLARRRMGSHAQ